MKRWTLDELGTRVEGALRAADYVPAASGRVRAVPDPRTIRYYTTLGLVDRPSELRGRVAYYGRRHLLQLVAIKRLQAEGLSLRRVQERLGGLDDAALAALASLPGEDSSEVEAPASTVSASTEAADRGDFWSARPPAAPASEPASVSGTEPAPAKPLFGLTLADDVTLLVPGGQQLTASDLDALRRAAAPLVNELVQRGLLGEQGASK